MTDKAQFTDDQLQAMEELNIREALKHKPTRWLIWQILDISGVNADAFSSDSMWMSYATGRKSVGRDLLALLERGDPRIYPNLILENLEENDG